MNSLTREMVANALIAQFDTWVTNKERESQGFNRSPLIDRINHWVGVRLGSPYCIASDLYAAYLVCQKYGWKFPLPREAGTQAFPGEAPSKYIRPKGALCKKGDLVILQDISDTEHGHGVLVRRDEPVGSPFFDTDEGNTDGSGGREGDGFYQRVRSTKGDSSKRFRACVDICQWIADANNAAKAGG